MAKVAPAQTNFSGGEWSPRLAGRVDTERYKTGMKTCLRYIATIQGGLLRCPGTAYVAPTKTAGSKAARLKRFEFSTTQAYQLEFSDQKMRVYMNHAAVLETNQNISNITQANPAVVTYVGADNYANGDEVEISGVTGMTQVNGRRFTVANVNVGANTFELAGINSTAYTAYAAGGVIGEVYTLDTPYLEADLFQLNFRQSADVMYIAHPNYAPRKLTRTGHAAWTLTVIDFLDGPYFPVNTTATTITPSGTTGSVTLTASTPIFTLVTDIGRLVRIKHSTTWGYAKITAVASTTSVTATVINPFGTATASLSWRLGLWSDTTKYPGVVTFLEDRLAWGASFSAPQRIDGSKTGDYENMAPTATDGTIANDNAISFTLNSSDVQVIRWMENNDKGLVIGTVAGEWIMRASIQGEAITPTNVKAVQVTYYGSSTVQPVLAGDAIVFPQKSGRKLREVTYVYTTDKFSAPDLTLVAEHIAVGGFKQLSYQQDPQSIIWAVRNDGVLLGCTYERDADGAVHAGWHRHILGGTSDALGSAPVVESAETLPSPDGTRQELWMVVKRYINGQTVRYVEYLTKFFEDADAQADQFFVDCGLQYSGAPTASLGGLWHLEGQTLSVLGDGAVQPPVVVSQGRVTLTIASSKVSIGYGYNSDGQILRPEAGAQDGTALGKTRRAHRIGFLFHRTLGWKFGRDFNNLDTLVFRSAGDDLGVAVPLFSGIKSETIDMTYDFENEICWRQDQPTAGMLLAVMPQMVEQDR